MVEKALMDTLREGLQAAFTPEAEAAWAKVYGFLKVNMVKGGAC